MDRAAAVLAKELGAAVVEVAAVKVEVAVVAVGAAMNVATAREWRRRSP